MEWISVEDLKSHIDEYGRMSYGYIVYEILDDDGDTSYVDITPCADFVIELYGVGSVMIIQDPPKQEIDK